MNKIVLAQLITLKEKMRDEIIAFYYGEWCAVDRAYCKKSDVDGLRSLLDLPDIEDELHELYCLWYAVA